MENTRINQLCNALRNDLEAEGVTLEQVLAELRQIRAGEVPANTEDK